MNENKLINIQLIDRPNPPVRLAFNEEEIQALTESIKDKGILVPLLVRQLGERYEVIDGDCRLEAAVRLRYRQVPCVVRTATDSETHILRLLANLTRSNPDPVSEAIYISKAISSGVFTAEELAQKLNRSLSWVSDRLAIAGMPDYMQSALQEGKVKLGVALALNELDDDNVKRSWLASALNDGLSVKAAEDAVRDYFNIQDRVNRGESPPPAPEYYEKPPVIMYPCARCGEIAPLEELRLVRIHTNQCPQ